MNITVEGAEALERKLLTIAASGVQKAARKALGAGARLAKQAMKDRIPSRYKDARKAMGSSVKTRGGELLAKAGAAVGMSAKRLAKQKVYRGEAGSKKKGVGIGARNIDWLIMGTGPRYTGEKRLGRSKKFGARKRSTGNPRRYTGKMPAMPAVQEGWRAAQGQVEQTITDTFIKELQKESL